MELPNLGQHCFDASCKRLDFLPVKCDMCKNVYCNDHYSYTKHNCPLAFSKNVQVPVCPLCNTPVPGKADELPDIRVSRHIDSDCQSDKAVSRRKVYSNRCTVKGCKQKELIPVLCNQCCKNYCLRHRHPQDHSCTETGAKTKPMGKAGVAAVLRKQTSTDSKTKSRSVGGSGSSGMTTPNARGSIASQSLQGNISEEAALQLALQASLAETSSSPGSDGLPIPSSREHEDLLLAQAIAESERTHRESTGRRGNNCQVS